MIAFKVSFTNCFISLSHIQWQIYYRRTKHLNSCLKYKFYTYTFWRQFVPLCFPALFSFYLRCCHGVIECFWTYQHNLNPNYISRAVPNNRAKLNSTHHVIRSSRYGGVRRATRYMLYMWHAICGTSVIYNWSVYMKNCHYSIWWSHQADTSILHWIGNPWILFLWLEKLHIMGSHKGMKYRSGIGWRK